MNGLKNQLVIVLCVSYISTFILPWQAFGAEKIKSQMIDNSYYSTKVEFYDKVELRLYREIVKSKLIALDLSSDYNIAEISSLSKEELIYISERIPLKIVGSEATTFDTIKVVIILVVIAFLAYVIIAARDAEENN